ncbi:MAG: terpene cyclase/mutase family protein, partial [Planctomycetaceae bacterium]|nr:terpene cyclase/mutase family protein [Planctomycetaceae bacterium]
MRILFFLIFILLGSIIFGSDIEWDMEWDDVSMIDSRRIVTAIANGVQYLKSRQNPDGQWQYEVPGHTLGATAMCVLSFLDADVSKDDASLIRGIQALRQYRAGENIHDTYPIAVQTMALIRYGDPSDQPLLEHNIQWFLKQQIKDGSNGQGGWQYNSGFQHYSTFETYYVGLALYEAEQSGMTIPRHVWEQIRHFWERTQNDDGSWGYRPLSQGSGDAHSCTTNAGIISLILATRIHDSGQFRVEGDRIQCGQWDPHQTFARINRALNSLDKSLIRQLKAGPAWWNINDMNSDRIHGMHWVHYNLFVVENVGRLLGQRHIGRYDWYREGTMSL